MPGTRAPVPGRSLGRRRPRCARPADPAAPHLEGSGLMRIAMVSEHASPLATLGGIDAGGQNVDVAALSRAMADRGAQVVVHTRRDDPDTPRNVALARGVIVNQVDAGPASVIPKDELLPFMEEFADVLVHEW